MNSWQQRQQQKLVEQFESTEAYPVIAEAGLDQWPYFHGFRRGRWDGSLDQLKELALGYRATRGLGETRMERLKNVLINQGILEGG